MGSVQQSFPCYVPQHTFKWEDIEPQITTLEKHTFSLL